MFTTESGWYISPVRGDGNIIFVVRVLGVFLFEEFHGGLGDRDLANRSFSFGFGKGKCTVGVADVLLGDGDRAVFLVEVRPEQSDNLAFAEAGCKLQIEHGEDVTVTGRVKIRFHLFGREYFHLHLPGFRRDTILGGIADDEALLDRSLKGIV